MELMQKDSKSILYGCGVFSSIRVLNSLPFLWGKHWRRLVDNAMKVGIELSEYSEVITRHALDEIIAKHSLSNGRARITFADSSSSDFWVGKCEKKIDLLIITGDIRKVPANFRLGISPYHVNSCSPLTGVKTCNYLDKILALDEAKARGFDEAIQVNERNVVVSATMANVFWLKEDSLCTPSLRTGCLPGTTREFVMENLDCREVEVTLDELDSADAIFLTSAGLGVVQVAEYESRRFRKTAHPILELLPAFQS